MKCKKCGSELKLMAKFCPQCGEKVSIFCTECGTELSADTRFCPNCGKPVSIVINRTDEPVEETKQTETEKVISVSEIQQSEKVEEVYAEDEIKPTVPRTEETFWEELNQLGGKDENSKAVIDYFGKKFWLKNLYPYLEREEKVVVLHHIVHHNYATIAIRGGNSGVKEFLALTNKRVIKFVKSYWFKPKIRSCLFTEITSIEASEPVNAFIALLIGEKLRVHTSEVTIKIRSFGKGTAKKIEQEILRLSPEEKGVKGDNYEGAGSDATGTKLTVKSKKSGLKTVFVAGIGVFCVCAVCAALGIFLLSGDNGGEVSEYFSLEKSNLIKRMSRDGLKESMEYFYTKDGISVILDDENIDMLIIDEPGYTLYGLSVGEEYSFEKDIRKVMNYGYGLLQEAECQIVLGVTEGGDQWIGLELDDEGIITTIMYNRTGAQAIVDENNEIEADSDSMFSMQETEDRTYEDGTYVGRAQGFGGEIKAEVVVKDSQVKSVQLTGDDETPGLGLDALGSLKVRFEAAGSADIDVVAGCTVTSNGAMAAMAEALDKASKGEAEIDSGRESAGNMDEFILPESSSRYLNMDDLAGLDEATLRLARNEIYARHGRKYETEDLNTYFSSKSWYYGYLSADDFDDSVFNQYEKANLDLIRAAEGKENTADPAGEYYEALTKDSVANIGYSSYNGDIFMEVVRDYDGTIYVFFGTEYAVYWSGELNRTQSLDYGGICLMFNGTNHLTGEEDYLEVEWSMAEAIDYPTVSYDFDTIGISGSYSYAYMLDGN